jgi:two-component system, chemotaxis family, chemotaxis protein CheY
MAVDKSMRILIVDDFKTMLKIIESLLRQLGFTNIDEATDGQQALTRIKENNYQLILSDWNMEPMSGFDLLKAVRADAAVKHIPFVLITAESKPQNIIAAKQAGVSNYIVKPFNANTLKEKLVAVLGNF